MRRFTKEEMLGELRRIFLFEADHIALGAGFRQAEAFVGFTPTDGEYINDDPARVDLTRFQISSKFERAYDFAFTPSLSTVIDEEVQDLHVFLDGMPRVGGISLSAGEPNDMVGPEGRCRTVAAVALARWKLEIDRTGEFSSRELALLANMSEGAVRNAMVEKGEAGLRAIPGSKPVSVEYQEAKRWLSGRRGFIPLPLQPRNDVVLHAKLSEVRTVEEFTFFLRRHVSVYGDPRPDVVQVMDRELTPEELERWLDYGTFEFDLKKAQRIAEILDLDVALFVGKALEVALRRDAGHGGQP